MSRAATEKLPVLIIGAGVAGLTLAQGLRLHSVPFRVFERHSKSHSSQGHRFRISKEATAALNGVLSVQLQDLLARTVAEPAYILPRYVDVRKFQFDPPTRVEKPESMPIDRTWIRKLLMLDIEDAIEFEKEFSSYQADDGSITVSFADGSSVRGSFLVGADGLRSGIRHQLQPNRKLLHLERWITWGRTPLTETLRKHLPDDAISWFMAQDKEANIQAIVEPMIWAADVHGQSNGTLPSFSDYLYWAISTDAKGEPPKTPESRENYLQQLMQQWHPDLRLIFDSASHNDSVCVPVISSKPDIELDPNNPQQRVTLIGDAAHSMSPMGGSGGTTAICNAADLAATIGEHGIDYQALSKFEMRMKSLAKEKIEHSFRGGQKFWNGKEWYQYEEIGV